MFEFERPQKKPFLSATLEGRMDLSILDPDSPEQFLECTLECRGANELEALFMIGNMILTYSNATGHTIGETLEAVGDMTALIAKYHACTVDLDLIQKGGGKA